MCYAVANYLVKLKVNYPQKKDYDSALEVLDSFFKTLEDDKEKLKKNEVGEIALFRA